MLTRIVIFLFCLGFRAHGQNTCLKNGEVSLITRTEKIGQVSFEKKVVDSKTPINMTFVIPGPREIKKIKWRLNDGPIDVDNDGRPPVHYLLNETPSQITVTLVLAAPKQHFIGSWLMVLKDTDNNVVNQTCELTSPPLVHRFEETFRATEGHELKAVCRPASVPLPSSVRWYKVDDSLGLEPVDSAPDYHEIPGDTLLFTEVHKSDTGIYFCNVTGIGGTDSAPAYIKVKSRLAALWPFIGILAELIILLVTIIIYERHKAAKNKKAAEDFPLLASQVNAGGDTKASPSHSCLVFGHARALSLRLLLSFSCITTPFRVIAFSFGCESVNHPTGRTRCSFEKTLQKLLTLTRTPSLCPLPRPSSFPPAGYTVCLEVRPQLL
ncbi:hypothetical protein SprV_0902729300 [Sparganum proliferum]